MRFSTVRQVVLAAVLIGVSGAQAFAQVSLGVSPYVQDFNGIAAGLPVGWSVRTGASATALGAEAALTTAATAWNVTSGNFRNVASTTGLDSTSNSTAQSGSTNRALALRPTGSFGDSGAGFAVQLANTTGKQNFSLTLKHQVADNQTRVSTYTVQYSLSAAGDAWNTVGTFATGRWGSTEATYSFGSALNNFSGPVWIRIVSLTATTGSGSRDTYAIDDFTLSWETGSSEILTPTVHASAIETANVFASQATIRFTPGNGTQRLVAVRKGSAVQASPADGTGYTAAAAFGSGTDLGSGAFVVYAGPQNEVTVTGLEPQQEYHVAVFEFNGATTTTKYFTSGAPAFSFTTAARNFPINFEANTFGDWTAVSLASNRNWNLVTSAGNGAGPSDRFAEANGFGGDVASDDWLVSPVMVVDSFVNPSLKYALQTGFVDAIPGLTVLVQGVAGGTAPSEINPAEWSVLQTSLPSADNLWEQKEVELGGLPSTSHFRIAFRYQSTGTGSNTTKRVRVDNIELVNNAPPARPTTGATSFAILNVTTTSVQTAFVKGDGARRIVLMKEGTGVDAVPVDGNSYPSSDVFGEGTELGTGNFVVANGDVNGFTTVGLKPNTQYAFAVWEYNGTGASALYLTDVAFNGTAFTTSEQSGGGGGGAVDLFFSEYIEGYSNNKALELYNGTGVEVDLSKYRISGKNNGTDVITTLTWPTGTMLAGGAVRMIIDGAASDTLKSKARTGLDDILPVIPQNSSVRYATSFNGNDFRVLEKNNNGTWVVVDRIGSEEVPAPAVAWDVAGVAGATVNRTLIRKPFVNKGNTDWLASSGTNAENSEWEVAAYNSSTNFGLHTFDPNALVDPFDFTALASDQTTIQLSWRLNAAGHGALLVMSTDNQFTTPVNGTAYVLDDLIGGDKVISVGNATSKTLENLTAGQEYFFKIYSVNDQNNYSPGKMVRVAPVKNEPTAHVSNFRVTSFTGSSLSFAWTDDNGSTAADGYLIAVSADGANFVFVPGDGTEPGETNFLKKVNRGVQSVTFNFLANNVTYTAKIYPFSNRGDLINFKTDGQVPVTQGTTSGTSLFETIGGELKGPELITLLRDDYRVTKSLGYDTARERMYIALDVNNNDSLLCVYTGYGIKINRAGGGRSQAASGSINAEHTWPQSKGAENEPMRSDLHHLFPTWENVNSARGNLPFGEIPDNQVSTWWGIGTVGGLTTAPALTIRDKFSELRTNTAFEPREDHKGNAARAIFYFWMRWQNDALTASNQSFFEGMKETLYKWHYQDLPDEREVKRSNDIAKEQGNRNPFVHDTTLIRRAFFPHIGGSTGNTMQVNTAALQFNTRKLGSNDTLFVFVQNLSGQNALSLTSITIEGSNAFTTTASLVTIAAGKSGRIPVVFKPTAKQEYLGTLKFNNSFNADITTIPLSGRGGETRIDVRPAAILFDADNQQDNIRSFSVVNTGETLIDVQGFRATAGLMQHGQIFTQVELPLLVQPGDSVSFDIEVDLSAYPAGAVDSVFVMADGAELSQKVVVRNQSGTSNEETGAVRDFALHQNHPNPFNPSTRITFELPASAQISLDVYSITGQRIATIVSGVKTAGRHTVSFDASRLASGLYLYRLTTPSGVITKKMMLMK
jgi:endonuclease I